MTRKNEFPESEKAMMRARSNGLCEGCGVAEAREFHHRQYRSRMGVSLAYNGLHLCGFGNTSGCHGTAHTIIGEQLGWSIRSGHNPALVPTFRRSDRIWRRFNTDGTDDVLNPINALEYLRLIGAIKEGLVP